MNNSLSAKIKLSIICVALWGSFDAVAQNEVAIGSSTTKSNAILWLNGNGSQGLILPVVTNKSAVSNPDKGMIVYDDSDNKVWYRSNNAWVEVGGGGTSTTNLNLQLAGNALNLRDGTSVLSTVNIAGGTQSNGAFMVFTGGSWQFATLSGDVTGANGALQVNGIRGKTVATLPATAQALVYDPAANTGNGGWVFQPLSAGGGVTSISGTAPVTVSGAAATPVISLANAGITNALLATDAVTSNKILDGTITDADIANVAPGKLTQAAATSGQVLKWNGSTWAPAADDNTGIVYTAGTGISVTGTVITNTGDTDASDDLTNTSVAAGDVTGTFSNLQLAAGVVTTTELANNAVDATKLANNAVTTAKINANAVDATKLANDAVTTAKILDATITGADIAGTTITADKLAQSGATPTQVLKWNGSAWAPAADDNTGIVYTAGTGISVTGTVITNTGDTDASDDLTNASVAAGDVTGTFSNLQLAAGVVTTTELANNAVDATKLANSAVTTAKINANAVDATKLANDAVTTAKILDGTIVNSDISGSAAVAVTKLAPGSNGEVLTTSGGVATWQLQTVPVSSLNDLSDVTTTAPTNGQVLVNNGAGQFVNVSISGDAAINNTGLLTIANGAISGGTGGKISDGSITSADLANGAVTGGTGGIIADASITSADLANGAVSGGTGGVITDLSITNADISSTAAIAGTKINPAFGTQNISTTGTLSAGATTVTGLTIGTSAWPANASGVLTNNGTGTLSWGSSSVAGWSLAGNSLTDPSTDFIGTKDAQDLVFKTTDTEQVRITSNGNVGIGTNPGIAASAAALEIGRTGQSSRLRLNGSATNLQTLQLYGTDATTRGWALLRFTDDSFEISKNDGINGSTGSQTAFHINYSDLNVGIGTTAPAARLDVVGNIKITDGTQANGRVLTSDANGLASWQAAGAGSGWTLSGNNPVAANYIGTNNNVAFNIKVNNVNSGTINPVGGDENTAFGYNALANNNGSPGNVAIGKSALNVMNVAGTGFNTAVGYHALRQNTTGYNNTALGFNAGQPNTTGNRNVFIGANAGASSPVGLSRAAAIGYNAQVAVDDALVLGGTGVDAVNVGIGTTSPTEALDVNGNFNISAGNTIKVGGNTVFSFVSGGNFLLGRNSGTGLSDIFNVTLGESALRDGDAARANVAIGVNSQQKTTTAVDQVSIGTNAMVNNVNGTQNTAIGAGTIRAIVNGSDLNTALGYHAGLNFTSGDNNTYLGESADSGNGLTNATAIGSKAFVTQSNSIVLGSINGTNGATSNTSVGIGTTAPTQRLHVIGNILASGTITPSDLRYKKSIEPLANTLSNVSKLNGVTYYYRTDEFAEQGFNKEKQIGVIAQEIEKVYPELVTTGADGYKAVDYSKLTPILVEAIKELNNQNEQLKKEVEALGSEKGRLESKVTSFELQQQSIQKDVDELKRVLGMKASKN